MRMSSLNGCIQSMYITQPSGLCIKGTLDLDCTGKHLLKSDSLQIRLDLGLVFPYLTQPERQALLILVDAEGCAKAKLAKGLLLYFGPYLQEGLS